MNDFVLNCSRVGVTGGLRSFSEQVMSCLNDQPRPIEVVLPESIEASAGVQRIAIPAYLGSSSGVSLLRPIAWLAYSRFRFPVSRDRRILCTTHHALPQHKHQIVTVHDLRPYFFPDSAVQSFYFRRMLPRALERCEGILTVSETSRQLLMDIYGIEEAKIRVVPNALKLPVTAPQSEYRFADPPMHPPYLLMVGASWSHKNAEEVLRMHLHWAGRFRLKIVTSSGAYRQRLELLTSKLGIADKVDYLSGLTDDQLRMLYAHCTALVYPSVMEGFGLPPLEAMALGCRVIVSDIPVFRELYGPYPLYVTLGDEGSWESAFSRIDEPDPDNCAQAAAHARSFNLDRMNAALRSALHHFWA